MNMNMLIKGLSKKSFSTKESAKKIKNIDPAMNILRIKSRYVDDFNRVANIISNQFKVINSSQIYKGQNFEGYMEVENKLTNQANLAKIKDIVAKVVPYGYKDLVSVDLKANSEKEKFTSEILENKSYKKFSLFNNGPKAAGIVQAKLYFPHHDKNAGLKHYSEQINNDYGLIIEKLEENVDSFEIIEVLAEPEMGYIEESHTEFNRISKFMEMLKRNEILKNKLICVKSKKSRVIEKSLEFGINFVSENTGASDLNILDIVAQSKTPYIFSAYARQDMMPSNKSPVETYLQSIHKRLALCNQKDILSSNIAIDLNFDIFTKKFASELIKNLDQINKELDNVLISSITVLNKNEPDASKNHIKHLFSNGVNIIRFESFKELEKRKDYINSIKEDAAEKLAEATTGTKMGIIVEPLKLTA